mgnify:FL=1
MEKQSFGAWRKKTSKGDVISFTINNVRYNMWENKYKKEDRHPDFNIYVDDYKPKEADVSKQQAEQVVEKPKTPPTQKPYVAAEVDDDLPF